MYQDLINTFKKLANPEQAKNMQRFFKTGPGEYGAGDVFLGIRVPVQRKVAKQYKKLSLKDLQHLLDSKIHEHRFVALVILAEQYFKGDVATKKKIFTFYLKNTQKINNWDLVDISAPKIVGDYLLDKDWTILKKLTESSNLWERRIAILATFAFIRQGNIEPTMSLAKLLVNDSHDLMHKAVGWMLREVGKRDQLTLELFLKKYYQEMPRTMLRYAIEKFSEKKRQEYLQGTAFS